ncbi:MAG: SPL family radical SAM protein, partial [Bacillota bacterium]
MAWWVRVREIPCRSAVVKSGIPGIDFVLNPYTGCEHGCVYCYASFMMRFRPHAEPWGRFVDVKVNFPQILRRECRKVRSGEIMLSSVTDPYQPAEAEYGLTRECLRILDALQDSRSGSDMLPGAGVTEAPDVPLVSILTKSDLVARDVDVLSRMRSVQVGMTITTADDRVSRVFEPRAPYSSRRFRALETLAARGVYTWAFAAPLIPYY